MICLEQKPDTEIGNYFWDELIRTFKYNVFRVITDVKISFASFKVYSYRIVGKGAEKKYEYIMDAEDYFNFVRTYGKESIVEEELLTPKSVEDIEKILPDGAIVEEDAGKIVVYAPEDKMGLFIGKDGWKTRRLSEIMQKPVAVVSGYVLRFSGMNGYNVRAVVERKGKSIDEVRIPLHEFARLGELEGVRVLSKGLGLGGIAESYLMTTKAYHKIKALCARNNDTPSTTAFSL